MHSNFRIRQSRAVRRSLLVVGAVLAIGLTAEAVSAQSCGYNNYGYGRAHHGAYYGGNFHNGGGYGSYISLGYQSYRVPRHTWHDTSHWDYVPTRVVPHGNHFDVLPGGYRYHRTGHVHHNH